MKSDLPLDCALPPIEPNTVAYVGSGPATSSLEQLAANSSDSDRTKLPNFDSPSPPTRLRDRAELLARLQPGRRLGEFELVRELGAGSFGRVYLARQLSLDRLVAVKVTTESSGEARALAALEHDNIVRVFGEEVEADDLLHLLYMQYVPGATLGRVLDLLGRGARRAWTGRDILDVVAACDPESVEVGAVALRDRERLGHCDHIEAVCWLGARLAEALDHAHRQGILHRDIKPSNVLLNGNGRVLLTDFNLAAGSRGGEGRTFGGTLHYMAPEHLEALNPDTSAPRAAVDARSDIYSLGVVLFELLTGRRPFGADLAGGSTAAALRSLAAERRREAPSPRQSSPDVPPVLDRVVRRCLAPDPEQRYQSAGELAQVLDGCRELYGLNRAVPAGRLTRTARRHPMRMALLLPLLPHLVAALVVFGYTAVWVANHPARPVLERLIDQLGVWYCAVAFTAVGGIAFFLTRPIWRTCARLQSSAAVSSREAAWARQRALRKPTWGVTLSGLGWLPGAILLPLLVCYLAPQAADRDMFLQYFLSFLIAGLIALTYTEFADQFLVLCVAYPALWVDPINPRQTARQELGRVERRLRVFQVLSALIPLIAAIALMVKLVSAGPEQRASPGYLSFLLLVTGLMVLGMVGSWLAVVIGGRLSRVASALAGGRVEPVSP